MNTTFWSVRSSSKMGGNWVKGVNVGIVNLESYKFHFIRVHDNLVQDPSNDESILFILNITAFPLTP